MNFDHQNHHRHSIRLKGYDYTQPGGYFVTLVAFHRECLFGEVVDGEMQLNAAGKIVQWEWARLAQRFEFIELGTYIVMPNHFHGILIFHDVRATRLAPSDTLANIASLNEVSPGGPEGSPLPANGPSPASLGAIIAQFKSRVTKRLWRDSALSGVPIWQRNYYEHILRDDADANRIHLYIESNPANWPTDEENPEKTRPAAL